MLPQMVFQVRARCFALKALFFNGNTYLLGIFLGQDADCGLQVSHYFGVLDSGVFVFE